MHKYVEGLWQAWFWHSITMNDRLVGTCTTDHVVGLHSQDFAQGA